MSSTQKIAVHVRIMRRGAAVANKRRSQPLGLALVFLLTVIRARPIPKPAPL